MSFAELGSYKQALENEAKKGMGNVARVCSAKGGDPVAADWVLKLLNAATRITAERNHRLERGDPDAVDGV